MSTRTPACLSAHHPRQPWQLGSIWWLLLALAIAWDVTGLDQTVMRHIGTSTGFALRNNWWLEQVLHTGLRQLATVLFLLAWVWACWPSNGRAGLGLDLTRSERITVMTLVTLSLATISILKHFSQTSCPWDLQAFGGTAQPISHWRLGQSDGGPGHCFPGGHVSSAFAFLAMSFPWLLPSKGHRRRPAAGWWWLAVVIGVGLMAGAAQTFRGAHPPSHTLWTLVICSTIGGLGWRWSMAFGWFAGLRST
jgi:membrane-associated PAP2 superfamily phosphatase